ncbi:serine/threonine protein phosphatase [Marinihelvus fidelis]|uniref:Serine/threonine protein phosphatase n=1 Tax=Marinihelvus fidelis TaxID=2613842 RepID=A0A5N0TDB8_9GAMM|nr:metallophosphoesterase [Marinihelvus fidelis]KAA9132688.1 serine/threonine protein phosphatase [Marinihelvus fidelis]
MNRRGLALLLVVVLLAACSPTEPFLHSVEGTARPWTHEQFDDPGQRVTFALVSDLTGGERPGVFAAAVEQLNLLAPELVLNVGDLIEGETTDTAMLAADWDAFDERAERSHAPVFRVGGNHDLSHPASWSVWEQRHGPRYYHFVYRDLLFLVLDTEDNTPERQMEIEQVRENSMVLIREKGWGAFDQTEYSRLEERISGRIGRQQADDMIAAIDAHPDVRWTFVLMHKPAWKRPGEENFSRIETALQDRDYTVFNGHEHFYELTRRHDRDYIQLGTTGGFQPDHPMAIDHVTLVTVVGDDVNIANLRLSGIFDRFGETPGPAEVVGSE